MYTSITEGCRAPTTAFSDRSGAWSAALNIVEREVIAKEVSSAYPS